MIEFIASQTLIVSLLIITLCALRKVLLQAIGAKPLYTLWALIPLSLLLSLSDWPVIDLAYNLDTLSHYQVTLQTNINAIESPAFSWLTVLWILGTVSFISLSFYSHYNYSKHLHTKAAGEQFQSLPLPCRVSAKINGPILLGILQPQLILPQNFNQQFSKEQQLLLIEHELVHFKRGDHYWNALALGLLSLFWFNPLCWMGYKSFRQCQEMACDQQVLKDKQQRQQISYANAMLDVSGANVVMAFTHLHYGDKNNMKQRLLQLQKNHPRPLWRSLAIAAMGLGTCGWLNLASALPSAQKASSEQSVYPIYRAEPVYPKTAADKWVEGKVVLNFSINTDGSVSDVVIVESEPEGVFEESARTALKQWQYSKPASKLSGQLVQLDFVLSSKPQKGESKHERIAVTK